MIKRKRMHPAVVIIEMIGFIKGNILPLLFLFFVSGTSQRIEMFRYLLPIGFVFLLLLSVWRWMTYRYELTENELYIEQGIVVKKRRYMTPEKVQSFDISAGIAQQLFGLVRCRIETAGGGNEPEVNMKALTKEDAERIRQHLLFNQKAMKTEEKTVEPYTKDESFASSPIFDMPIKDLFIAGITSGGVGLVFSALAALFSQIDEFLPSSFYQSTVGYLAGAGIRLVVILFLAITVAAWVISIGITILKYGRFRIEKADEEIIISRGLIEKRQLTIQRHRVTAIRFVSNVLRQPFSYWSVYIESGGGGSEEEQSSTLLIPLASKVQSERVVSTLFPTYDIDISIDRLPKRSLIRYIVRAVFPTLLITIPVMIWVPYGQWTVLLPILAVILGWFRYRDAGIGWNYHSVLIQSRMLHLSKIMIPRRKIQAAGWSQSYFQRKSNVATVSTSIMASLSGKTFHLKDLTLEKAMQFYAWYSKGKNQCSDRDG